MSSSKKNLERKEMPKHKVLRETFKHFLEFRSYVSSTGNHFIKHGYWVTDEDGNKIKHVMLEISYPDLFGALEKLPPRKKEAVFLNVILDMTQREAAEKMGITTVSVGQYVDQAFMTLAESYFPEEVENV